MNKKTLLFLIPIAALLLSGCGKREPGDTTVTPTSDTSASPTSGTTSGTTGSSSTSDSSTSDSSSSSGSTSGEVVPVTGVNISESLYQTLTVGDDLQIHASVTPEEATDKELVYESADPTKVSVSATGLIHAEAKTTEAVDVTVKAHGDLTKTKAMHITVKEAPIALPASTADGYSLVTSGTLEEGTLVYFASAYESNVYTMKKYASGNNIAAVAGTINENVLTIGAETESYEVVVNDGKYSFKDSSDKYLYAAGAKSSNHLKTETPISDKSKFTLTWESGVPTLEAVDENTTRNQIKFNYNSGTTIFSCYASSSTSVNPIALYAKAPTPKTVESIAVKTAPTKTIYGVGEEFSPTGLVITVTYNDESTEDVAYAGHEADFAFAPAGALEAGTTSITITYKNDKFTTQDITMDVLESINVDTTSFKKEYFTGETWDLSGLEITAHYTSSGDVPLAIGDVEIEMQPEEPAEGECAITVRYGGRQGGAIVDNIHVVEPLHITYDGNGATSGEVPVDVTNYKSGDHATILGQGTLVNGELEFMGWTTDQAGTETVYTEGSSFEVTANTTLYAKWMAVSYQYEKVTSTAGITDGQYLVVFEAGANSHALDGSLNAIDAQNNFITVTVADSTIECSASTKNAEFTIRDNQIKATKTGFYIYGANGKLDQTEDTPAAEHAFSIEEGKAVIKYNNSATLQYNDAGSRFRYYTSNQSAVQLYKKSVIDAIVSVEVSGAMSKIEYNQGDDWDTAGLIVTATHASGLEEVVADGIEWSFTPNSQPQVGDTSVNVIATVGGVTSDPFEVTGITVTDIHIESIDISGTMTKTEYLVGDEWEATGLIVTGTYSDSPEHTVDLTESVGWSFNPANAESTEVTSVTVTASYLEVAPAEIVVPVTVTAAPVPHDVTFTAGTDVGTSSATGNTDQIIKNGITVYCTNAAFATAQYRAYKNSTLTISGVAGLTIKEIIFVDAGSSDNPASNLALNDGQPGSYDDLTWTGSASSISFNANAGQARISAIQISYTGEFVDQIESISVEDPKTAYQTGDTFVKPTVIANYTSGLTEDVTEDALCTGYDMSEASNQTVTVTYIHDAEEYTTTYDIVVSSTVNGAINFGTASGSTSIESDSVTGNDSQGKEWTITTEGTSSFTKNAAYSQIGSSKNPATSITFTVSLGGTYTVTALSISLGGFSGTAGDVTLKVGSTTIGSGSLSAGDDVDVSNSSEASGTTITITITNIAKGVKVYGITYSLA